MFKGRLKKVRQRLGTERTDVADTAHPAGTGLTNENAFATSTLGSETAVGSSAVAPVESSKHSSGDLSTFDACIEAADEMAANDAGVSGSTEDGGISDCSVLVSPDGALLFLPNEKHQIMGGLKSRDLELLSSMYPSEEVTSAIVTGSDLHQNGDRAANGFSARGWSPDAASLALRRSEEALRSTSQFVNAIATLQRDGESKIGSGVCNTFRDEVRCSSDSRAKAKSKFGRNRSDGSQQRSSSNNEESDGDAIMSSSFSKENKLKTSPLFFPGSTLHAAATSMIQYHVASSEGEQSIDPDLSKLLFAAEQTRRRSANREAALKRAHRRVENAESTLAAQKAEATKRWDLVHKAEKEVQKVYEERVRERSRELYNRKIASDENSLHRLKEEDDLNGHGSASEEKGAEMSSDIWQLVQQIGSEEDGSYHPVGIPDKLDGQTGDKSLIDDDLNIGEDDEQVNDSMSPDALGLSLPPIDRGDVEFELNVPTLRAAALEADTDVEDAATAVLTALSALDTTNRSARIAAESGLLSAANAQARALKDMVKRERAALDAKMKQLELLEKQVDTLDVRADLDAYIAFDKRERPGSMTLLGEDDDGGVASALAVLDGHADGNEHGVDASQSMSSFERFGGVGGYDNEAAHDKHKGIALSREEIDKVIANLFAERTNDDEAESLDDAGSLVLAVSLRSARGRGCRASTCYALNRQRSVRTEIATNEQFDGICRVFYALLKGCDARVPSDVANGRMCMMLSQSFYVVDHDNVMGEDISNGSESAIEDRKQRFYVKSTLVNHPFFSQEDFWVHSLHQCVTQAVGGSRVVSSNFDSSHAAPTDSHDNVPSRIQQSKWYDLNAHERAEAASQVHAVIFAQLGALSHSMVEFGCDIEKACAFVRRLSIQHQLPLSQRSMLLQHLVGQRNDTLTAQQQSSDVEGKDSESTDEADTNCVQPEDEVSGEKGNEDDHIRSNDPFIGNCFQPTSAGKRLIALLSQGVSDRTQSAHQLHCLQILKARGTAYAVVDGMDPTQRSRRDELFSISGTKGQYPQFFLSEHDEVGTETAIKFLGGYERLKDLNDTVDLPTDVLELNPDLETWDRLLGNAI